MSWEPYKPPWCPLEGNVFGMNGETGSAAQTRYAEWADSFTDEEYQRLIAESKTPALAEGPHWAQIP